MNKKLLPAVIAMAFAGSAFAESDVYGKINLSLQNADEGDSSTLELRNNNSRLGFKGTEDVDGGLTVIYQYELGVDPSEGNTTWTKRNSFLGIKGDFGKVRAGFFDTAMKSSQGKVDLFNDLEGDIASIITRNDNRVSNVVSYTTPSASGISATVDYIMSENEDVDAGVSGSVSYSNDSLYLAVAADSKVEWVDTGTGLDNDTSTVRAVAAYTISAFQLGALYESFSPPGDADSVSGWLVSGKYSVNKWDLKAQYGASDIVQEGGTSASIGVDYNLTSNFTWLSYITSEESDLGLDDTYIGFGGVLKF